MVGSFGYCCGFREKTGETIKVGTATGVYASELTEPYYTFLDAQMEVDVASIQGGKIPIEKLSLMPLVRTEYDVRFMNDPDFQEKTNESNAISEINFSLVSFSRTPRLRAVDNIPVPIGLVRIIKSPGWAAELVSIF